MWGLFLNADPVKTNMRIISVGSVYQLSNK